jgi:periplasmic protein CpxP/Spy
MTFSRIFASAAVALALTVAAPAALAQDSTLQGLHDSLHLNVSQEDAWRTFEAASQPSADQAARARAAQAMLPHLTSPQRVDLSIAAMQADLETMRARGAALKAFYAVLSAGQQQIFDRQTLPVSEP